VSASQIFARAPIDVTVAAGDGGSGVASVALERAPRGSGAWTAFATATTAPYTAKFNPAGLADGAYDVRATVTDAAGNVAHATTAVTVATSGFAVALADPGAVLTGTVALRAATTGLGAEEVVFEIRRGATGAWLLVGTDKVAPWAAQLDTQALRDGQYDLRVTSIDADGISASDVRSGIVVDNTAPALVASSPASGGKVPARGARVVMTATEVLARVTGAKVDGKATKAPAVSGSKATFSVASLRAGAHTLTGTLVDRAGLSAAFSLRFVVDALTARLGTVSRSAAYIAVPVTLSQPAVLATRLVSPAGKTIASRRLSAAKGRTRIALRLAGSAQPGRYTIVVRATAGGQTVNKRVAFTVRRTGPSRGGTWLIVGR
jgi:hypothetical protein